MKIDRYRVAPGDRKALTGHRTDQTGRFRGKDAAVAQLEKGVRRLAKRQELLYAQGRHALLLVFQGMDASGKDSAIGHVMSGVNPLGTEVHAFKQPSSEELAHDYLWRAVKVLPGRGRIGIFNRSYYEEVLVVRVHPALLDAERLPTACLTGHLWRDRLEDIRAFEQHLSRNGTVVRKFFLHVSRKEQRERLLARLDDPTKSWKFAAGDVPERAKWDQYMRAYSDALAATSTKEAPWYVIPADRKWFAHALIAEIIVQTLDELDLAASPPTGEQKRAWAKARRQLQRER
jgi:PPK2 family polyphosphate:nucleotide phosphotransferase